MQATRLATALADRYRIERELGAGGMATVYLAHDLKHDRRVAIKVLKPELAAVLGAERFVVEIRTTASLQHPHILPLFDSGTADGFLYYVMPYIEGETIRDRLNRETQCGIDEAVRIAREVADALDYAHRHGVIHRDIKPENILLHDGRAMVMDFGIALAVSAAAGGRMTETGLSLGTPHYMSPEQATAEKDLTPRSDVYSLGSVLFEMLAGEPPHTAGSAQGVIMKIVTDQARPVNELRRNVPPNVAAAVARSLEKLPADRFPSARAFADALADQAFDAPARARTGGSAGQRRGLGVAAVTLVALAGAGGWLAGRKGGSTEPARALSLSVVLPDSTVLDPTYSNAEGQPVIEVGPDGTVAYTARVGTVTRLFLRPLGTFSPRPIDGTEGAYSPFFSPDGSTVQFFVGTKLMRVSVADGRVTQLADGLYEVWGGAAAADGRIIVGHDRAFVLQVFAPTGDTVASMSCPRRCALPSWIPGGTRALVTSAGAVLGVADLERRTVTPLRRFGATTDLDPTRGSMARYDGDGHVVWLSPIGEVMAAPFDPERAVITGPPVALAQGVRVETGRGAAQFSVSRTSIALVPGALESIGILVRADRAGRLDTIPTTPANFTRLDLTPDGTRILAQIDEPGGPSTIGVVDAMTGQWTPWMVARGPTAEPSWDPDGVHAWYRIGDMAFRGNPAMSVAPDSFRLQPGAGFQILRDGQRYRFFRNDSTFVARLDGAGPPVAVPGSRPASGPVSGDGVWIVQEEQLGRQSGIVARALDGSGRFLIVSNRNEFSMAGSTPDGHEFFVAANERWKTPAPAAGARTGTPGTLGVQSFWAVSYSPGAAKPFGEPTLLFEAPVADFPGRNYGVGLKGQRFVFKQRIARPPLREIRLLQGWHAALNRGDRRP